MLSNEIASPPYFFACVAVIADVSVVFPWSTCPIVPTFTCGFVRSNFALPIALASWLPFPENGTASDHRHSH